jgi:argonaute-like protein implicated in RNA metabolism and viral defense
MDKETNDSSTIDAIVESITNKLKLYAEGQKTLAEKIDANAAQARQMNQEFNYKMTSFIKTSFERMGERLDTKIDELENSLTKKIENSDKIVMARVDHKLGGIQDNLKIREN